MKKVITEKNIIDLFKKGQSEILINKYDLITPLAKDKIKELKFRIRFEENATSNTEKQLSDKIYIGSDHTGFQLKKILIKFLADKNKDVEDLGTFDENSCDYPDYAAAVAKKVILNKGSFGILIDATGIPSAITANKFKGVRAATCYNEFTAWSARNHNNANILVIGAKTIGEELAKSIINKWFETQFEGGRHQKRLDKISKIENDIV